MYKKKLEPLDILEKIKLSMNYDMSKTLNENRGLIVESALDNVKNRFKWCKDTSSEEMNKWERKLTDNQITAIAKNINTKLNEKFGSLDSQGDAIENYLNGVPTRRDFCRLIYTYYDKYSIKLITHLDKVFWDSDFTKISSGLNNAFKYKTAEESNKKSPTKSIIDKKSSGELAKKLKDSVSRQILLSKDDSDATEEFVKLLNNARANDVINKYLEARRTNQTLVVGDSVLNKYLNKMVTSLSSGGGDFISTFEYLVNVRKGTLGDLKRLQELRYSQNGTSFWNDIVKLPYKKPSLWKRLAASLDQMVINGNSNLKFEKQPKKTLADFKSNYPCLDYGTNNFVGKNENSKYFIFQKDANGTNYKFYWPIMSQGDKGMVFLSKSHGYYGPSSNNAFITSSDTNTGFKWSCSGTGGIGRSKVIIENKVGNLLEGDWTLPTKKKDTQVKTKVNTGGQQETKSKYQLCTGTYKKGCKDNEGIISKVQGCLGLGVDGKFGPKTEEVIYSKLNRNSFTKSDVDTLCNTSQISDPKIVEPKLIEPEVVKLTDLENI